MRKGGDLERLGMLLRQAHERRDMSQKAAAEVLGIGQSRLSRYEIGAALIDMSTLQDLIKAFHVPTSQSAEMRKLHKAIKRAQSRAKSERQRKH